VQTKYDIQIAIPDLKAAHSSAMHVPSLNYTRNAFDTGLVIIDIAWYLDLQLPIQLVQITTDVVSSGDVYSIQHYVIKFVSCCRSLVFSGYPCFFHKSNWPSLYNWHIVESGVKHHNPNPYVLDLFDLLELF